MPYGDAMNKAKEPRKPEATTGKKVAAAARRAKLAEALKTNLQKRKAQARARDGAPGGDDPESSS